MSIELFGFLITTIGELVVGYSILRVHNKLAQEKKVDRKLINEVKHEKHWTILGMFLIALGFLVQLASERFL